MLRLRAGFLAFFLVLVGVLCGCSLFDLQNEVDRALPLQPRNGSANVAFNVVIPGRASLSPTVRASGTPAEVTFRITLLQPGNTTNPTIDYVKTAVVQSDGSAATTFSALPEGAAIGEISIAGGNIGGKSQFHGAADLFPGENTMTVSPKGSLHDSDILANAILAIAADPELIKISKPNLVTNVANAAAAIIANPTANVYAEVLETATQNQLAFDTSKYSQIDISSADGTLRATGLTSWSITPDKVWQGTPVAGTGLLPVTVVRQGIGDYAIIAWQNTSGTVKAFSRQSSSAGTLLYYLLCNGSNGFMPQGTQTLPGDGSVIAAGSYSGRPALIRWSGSASSDLSSGLSASGITWNHVFDIASTNAASASISYLEYDKTGTGKILCQVKDPTLGNRLFQVDPATGAAVEQQQTNNFGLWTQVGSGSVALGWDGMDAATGYNVFYATGTVLATETAPVIACKDKVLLFENLVNGQVYTFLVGALDADNKYLSWSSPIKATPIGADEPIIYSNWKLNANVFEIGSANWPSNVKIISFDAAVPSLVLEITGTSPFSYGSIIAGVFNDTPVCLKLLTPSVPTSPAPPSPIPQTVIPPVEGASMQEVFSECKYLFRGRMSQLPVMSEKLLKTSDPAYQMKMNYLRGGMRRNLRAGLTRPIEVIDPSYGDLSLEMDNFEFDPDVVVAYETFLGTVQQFEMRVDGYAACDIYAKFVASRAVELTAVEGTLLPHTEIPFFVGPVPGTWGREVTASWKFILKAEAEVKTGTKMRVDFRSGTNWSAESGWKGQLLWKVRNTPMFEAKLQGTFTNEAAIEMKNSLKVGGLAGPELTIKPYIKTEATLSTEKPCQIDAALSMGMQGELKAIVQAWSYNIGEWGSEFEPFGPWVIASNTVSANATPTLKITGPAVLTNDLLLRWPTNWEPFAGYYSYVCTSTGTDSFVLSMDDSRGLNQGLSKIEVSVDDNPTFLSFTLASHTTETGQSVTPYPLQATLTMKLPLAMNANMETLAAPISIDYVKWYTPFRLDIGSHELLFKVYDKCGDFSIATFAVEVTGSDQVLNHSMAEGAASLTYEFEISGYQSGAFPARERTIPPTPAAFDIYPFKAGKVILKHWVDGGYDWTCEGAFSADTRSGSWTYQGIDNETRKVEFDSSGNVVNAAYNGVFVCKPSEEGVDIRLKIIDTHQAFQDLAFDDLITGTFTLNSTSGSYSQRKRSGSWKSELLGVNYECAYLNDLAEGAYSHRTSVLYCNGQYAGGVPIDTPWQQYSLDGQKRYLDVEKTIPDTFNPSDDPSPFSDYKLGINDRIWP